MAFLAEGASDKGAEPLSGLGQWLLGLSSGELEAGRLGSPECRAAAEGAWGQVGGAPGEEGSPQVDADRSVALSSAVHARS